jgi:hypothetical protein
MVKNKEKSLTILIVVLTVLLLSLFVYIIYTRDIKREQQKEDDTTVTELQDDNQEVDITDDDTDVCEVGEEGCEEETTEENELASFEGEVLSAQLPLGWNIVEYFNGDGTDSLPEEMGEYSGLTAIDIINPVGLQVFTIQAVSGIGFLGCPNYALFEDDNPAYNSEQQTVSDEIGETFNVIDYTDEEYSEFEFLGVTFRRIGKKYFYDTQEGNNYFEPPCVEGLLTLEGLYFTDDDGYKYEAYFYGPTEDSTEADLVVVDQILSSIELL